MEPDGAFADALQQARRGTRPREAQTDRKAEPRKTETPPSEPQALALPADVAETVADLALDAAGAGAGEAETRDSAAPAGTLPPWLESALARAPVAGTGPRDAADATEPGTEEEAPGRTAGPDRAATRRSPAETGESGRAQRKEAATVAGAVEPTGRTPGAAGIAFKAAIAEAAAGAHPNPAEAERAAAPVVAPALPQAAGLAAAAVPVPATKAEAVERPMAAHVHSPEFAPALGAQLSIFVKDGVSEARLHLNPAEMGPITVQIHIEGQTARVEMVAEHAATRQVLEASMPVLAGALRDSGLTLTGGGVFEQARDPRQDRPENRPTRGFGAGGGHDDAGPGPDAGRPVALPAGMVDLYA